MPDVQFFELQELLTDDERFNLHQLLQMKRNQAPRGFRSLTDV